MNNYKVFMKTYRGLVVYEVEAKNQKMAVSITREVFNEHGVPCSLKEVRKAFKHESFSSGHCFPPFANLTK